MTPSRRRQQFVPSRPRAEVITAVAVAAGIVVGTVLLIWLIRPGTPGVPGQGGLLSRQPRMTLLLLVSAVVLGAVLYWVTRSRRRPKRLSQRGSIIAGSAVVVVLAIVGGILWPGGIVRHWPKQPKLTDTPATNPISVPSTASATTGPGTTAKPGTTATTGTTVTSATSSSATPTTKGR